MLLIVGRTLFLLVLMAYQTACYLNSNIADLNSNSQSGKSDSTVIPSVPSLILQAPGYLIYDDATPSFEVSNLSVGNTLKLYRDASCTTEITSISVATNPQVITSPALTDGSYQCLCLLECHPPYKSRCL